MNSGAQTLKLLERIAAANGVAVDDFLHSQRGGRARSALGSGWTYRSAAMLPRFFRAFLALPGTESRLRAVRMMEGMAERAHRSR